MFTLTEEESLVYIEQARLKAARNEDLSEAERILAALSNIGRELTADQVESIVKIMGEEYERYKKRCT